MIVFPAIDLCGGRVVRLTQGDYSKEQVYSNSPVTVATGFKKQGATHLHVVDLDGAKDGTLSNFETIKEIISTTDMFVEVGGGIRDNERIKKYIDCGAKRVILGTAAAQSLNFVAEMCEVYGDYISVGVDAKDGFVATKGWLNVTQIEGIKFCRDVQKCGCRHIIYTDISKDGLMNGTNIEVYKTLKDILDINITASGGIHSVKELQILSKIDLYAAILGKAIYTGAIDLATAIKAVKEP